MFSVDHPSAQFHRWWAGRFAPKRHSPDREPGFCRPRWRCCPGCSSSEFLRWLHHIVGRWQKGTLPDAPGGSPRSEEHTSELQSRGHLVCRLLLEKKNKKAQISKS